MKSGKFPALKCSYTSPPSHIIRNKLLPRWEKEWQLVSTLLILKKPILSSWTCKHQDVQCTHIFECVLLWSGIQQELCHCWRCFRLTITSTFMGIYPLFNINGVQEQFCKHMYFHLMLTLFYVGYMGGWHSPSVKLLNPGCTACASESGLPLNNLSGGLHGSKHVYFQWAPPLLEDLWVRYPVQRLLVHVHAHVRTCSSNLLMCHWLKAMMSVLTELCSKYDSPLF
jgi:hypothetical protein